MALVCNMAYIGRGSCTAIDATLTADKISTTINTFLSCKRSNLKQKGNGNECKLSVFLVGRVDASEVDHNVAAAIYKIDRFSLSCALQLPFYS